jgi:hypothetical protein
MDVSVPHLLISFDVELGVASLMCDEGRPRRRQAFLVERDIVGCDCTLYQCASRVMHYYIRMKEHILHALK